MVLDTAIMRCDICKEQRPEPMLTLASLSGKKDGEVVTTEVRHCAERAVCTRKAIQQLRDFFGIK